MKSKERAGRNRTITLTADEEQLYLDRCITGRNVYDNDALCNTTVIGDCFEIIPKLPDKFVDLLIVDPPYNLDKTFNKNKFRKMKSEEYEFFTRQWIEACIPRSYTIHGKQYA